jgi:hypothetical protein
MENTLMTLQIYSSLEYVAQIPALNFFEGIKPQSFEHCGIDWLKCSESLNGTFKTLDVSFINTAVRKMKSFCFGVYGINF